MFPKSADSAWESWKRMYYYYYYYYYYYLSAAHSFHITTTVTITLYGLEGS